MGITQVTSFVDIFSDLINLQLRKFSHLKSIEWNCVGGRKCKWKFVDKRKNFCFSKTNEIVETKSLIITTPNYVPFLNFFLPMLLLSNRKNCEKSLCNNFLVKSQADVTFYFRFMDKLITIKLSILPTPFLFWSNFLFYS